MADGDFNLLAYLKCNYPTLPITSILKVMNKFENDQEKCRQALALEAEKRSNNSSEVNSALGSSAEAPTSSSNLGSPPSENKTIASRIKELKVSHEGNIQQKPVPPERHVSTIERSIGREPRPSEPKVAQSMLWTVQTTERPDSSGTQFHANLAMKNNTTAPPDFTPFVNRSTTDIPNIDCRTHGGISHGARPHQISVSSSSASSSPAEQRRPVKVINIPPGSLSGGSVSPAATPPSSRHILMHFGDAGGICTVSTPPSNIQRYGSTPNVSQQYRSEFRTEASVPQPLHSSSIVVNTTSHTNHLIGERKTSSGNGMRTQTPNLILNTVAGDTQFGNVFPSCKPLSTPVQASSPGISHSKPVFVEKRDHVHSSYNESNYASGFYPGTSVRPPPNSSYFSHHGVFNPGNYPSQYNHELPNNSGFGIIQSQQEQQYPVDSQQKHPGYSSPPTNMYQSSSSTGYNPNSYPSYNTSTNIGFPAMGITGPATVVGHVSGQAPSHLSHYTYYSPHGNHSPGIHMPKSPGVGTTQPALNSRSNSQDSEHSMGGDYDSRQNLYNNNMGSRVSSHSSLSSDSSSNRIDRAEHGARPRSGSIQDEADYIRALLQHQKSRKQKLLEDMNHHQAVLNNLRADVSIMEKHMIENSHVNKSFPLVEDISRLCENNRALQTDIQMFMNEIDMYKSGQTPYNKINPLDQQNFYENMPTGQQDSIYSRMPDGKRTSSPGLTPPPRPPPPIPMRQRSSDTGQASGGSMPVTEIMRVPPVPPQQPVVNSGDSEEGESWSCSACTFSNHPALKKCEMCEMPRIMPPHASSSAGLPAVPPHQPLGSVPPRLAPGFMGNIQQHRSSSPHSALGHHHHHRAGT